MKFFQEIYFLFAIISFTTSLIENDIVHSLPDYDYNGLFYSGYLSASPVKYFHYIFHEADYNPDRKPLVLWLNGGPGCSSLSGWASEHGPMKMDKTGKFQLNEYSWHLAANMIYLESPGNVGFSYIDSDMEYEKQINDDITANDNFNALLDFFKKFPSYKGRDFYISGESYAGIYVPMLAYKVIMYNKGVVDSQKFNLKGILVGNGVAENIIPDDRYLIDFMFSHHLTSYENRMDFNKYCLMEKNQTKCDDVLNEITQCLENVNVYDILQDCELPETETGERDYFSNYYKRVPWVFKNLKQKQEELKKKLENKNYSNNNNQKKLKLSPTCYDDSKITQYLNRNEVKKALHVNTDITWEMCSDDVINRYKKQDKGSIWTYPILIESGIRILIYSGDTDLAVPFNENQGWIDNLNLPIEKDWVQWRAYDDPNNVSGYYIKYKGLTFCTVKGTGHMVPEWRPKEAYYMFSKFLNNEDF
jgi:carboxypeptidase C (cathepsin A)